jgi:hypothetical protein
MKGQHNVADESTHKSQDHDDELTSDYANNTFFEPSVWDLKIVFGEWSGRANSIDWHTSITLPWAQAKLMAYYLEVNVAAHELRMGKIPFPSSMVPQEPPPPPDSDKDDPASRALFEVVKDLRQKFIDSLK